MTDEAPRRDPRVSHAFIARYRPVGSEGWLASPLRDFSRHGARFLCEHELPPGTPLEMRLQVGPAHQPIWVNARVAWVKPAQLMKMFELGVTFDPGDLQAQQTIEAAVQHFIRKTKGG